MEKTKQDFWSLVKFYGEKLKNERVIKQAEEHQEAINKRGEKLEKQRELIKNL